MRISCGAFQELDISYRDEFTMYTARDPYLEVMVCLITSDTLGGYSKDPVMSGAHFLQIFVCVTNSHFVQSVQMTSVKSVVLQVLGRRSYIT